jgi:hypothetical protein
LVEPSAGGEVGGLFDLVDRIHAIRAASGKPIWAIAAEAALSAAYAIASAADRIYVTQTGEAGSIGVVAVHVDESGADAQDGLAWTFIHAGARKVDGNPHQPLSDHARADLQADVDLMYGRFVAVVAAMPAQADGPSGTGTPNGASLNGASLNGGGENGVKINGSGENGTQESGTPTSTMSSDAPAFTLRGVILPAVAGILQWD